MESVLTLVVIVIRCIFLTKILKNTILPLNFSYNNVIKYHLKMQRQPISIYYYQFIQIFAINYVETHKDMYMP